MSKPSVTDTAVSISVSGASRTNENAGLSAVEVGAGWTLWYAGDAKNVADLLRANEIYFDDADAFPRLAVKEYSGSFAVAAASVVSATAAIAKINPAKSVSSVATTAIKKSGAVVKSGSKSLVGKNLLIATADAADLESIRSYFSVKKSWIQALKENEQGYAILCRASGKTCADILILGGSARGSFYGVTDFLKSLSSRSTASAKWAPQKVLNYPDVKMRAELQHDFSGPESCDLTLLDAASGLAGLGASSATCKGTAYAGSTITTGLDRLVSDHATHFLYHVSYPYYISTSSYAGAKAALQEIVSYLKERYVEVIPRILGFDYGPATIMSPELGEGLLMRDEKFTLDYDSSNGRYVLEPADSSTFQDGAPVNLVSSTIADLSGGLASSCGSGECLGYDDGGKDGKTAIEPDPAGGSDPAACVRMGSTGSSKPAKLIYRPDASKLTLGSYYALGYDIYQSADVTKWQMTYVDKSSSGYQIVTSDTAMNQGAWSYHTLVFRYTEDRDVSFEPYFYMRLLDSPGTACVKDVKLHAIGPQMLNVLGNQGVTVTDASGNEYASGSGGHYSLVPSSSQGFTAGYFSASEAKINKDTSCASKAFGSGGWPCSYFDTSGDVRYGNYAATVVWDFADTDKDGADDDTGLKIGDTFKVTYASLLPYGAKSADPGPIDVTLGAYWDDPRGDGKATWTDLAVEGVLDLFGENPPEYAFVGYLSEIRGMRRGASAGQTGSTNAAYVAGFAEKVETELASRRGGTDVLRPLYYSDMFTELQNGGENYQFSYGGNAGGTVEARDDLPAGSTFAAWYYHDCPAMAAALVEDFASVSGKSFKVLGTHANDQVECVANARDWTSLAAGAQDMAGVMSSEWNDAVDCADGDVATYFPGTARLAWNSGYAVLAYHRLTSAEETSGEWSASSASENDPNKSDTCSVYDYPAGFDHGTLVMSSGQSWTSAKIKPSKTRGDEARVRVLASASGADPKGMFKLELVQGGKTTAFDAKAFTSAVTTSKNGFYAVEGSVSGLGTESFQIKLTASSAVTLDDVVIFQSVAPMTFPVDPAVDNPFYPK